MIHYALERNDDGTPARLVWSPQIQRETEARLARQAQERSERERRERLPMASMREWAERNQVGPR